MLLRCCCEPTHLWSPEQNYPMDNRRKIMFVLESSLFPSIFCRLHSLSQDFSQDLCEPFLLSHLQPSESHCASFSCALTSVMVSVQVSITKYLPLVACKLHKFISHSCKGWEVQDEGFSMVQLMRTLFHLRDGQLLTVSSHGEKWARELSGFSLVRELVPFLGSLPSWFNHLASAIS